MTPAELKEARHTLGLSVTDLARLLDTEEALGIEQAER